MARLSDIIEQFIKNMLEDNKGEELQIQRNELANYFSCAPSQINYVLTTRFTTEKGYIIESRRGGGGYIVIRQVRYNNHKNLSELINEKIGDSITFDSAMALIYGLNESEIITEREAAIMKAAVNDRNLNFADNKNMLRAELLRSMILVVLY